MEAVQRDLLKDNLIRSHNTMYPYQCTFCQQTFSEVGTLRKHTKLHTEEVRPFQCTLCPKSFTQNHFLRQHMKFLHSDNKPHQCEHCPASFSRKRDYVSHVVKHTGVKPYPCDHCTKSFVQKRDLTIHTKKHMEEKPFGCNNPGGSDNTTFPAFPGSQYFPMHGISQAITEKLYQCGTLRPESIADLVCKTEQQQQNQQQQQQQQNSTGGTVYRCQRETCSMVFTNLQEYREHSKAHPPDQVRPFQCHLCPKDFTHDHFMRQHMKFRHNIEKPHQCPHCPMGYTRKREIVRHIKLHNVEPTNRKIDQKQEPITPPQAHPQPPPSQGQAHPATAPPPPPQGLPPPPQGLFFNPDFTSAHLQYYNRST